MHSAASGHVAMVEYQITKGANVDLIDGSGKSALHWSLLAVENAEKIAAILRDRMVSVPDLLSVLNIRFVLVPANVILEIICHMSLLPVSIC